MLQTESLKTVYNNIFFSSAFAAKVEENGEKKTEIGNNSAQLKKKDASYCW